MSVPIISVVDEATTASTQNTAIATLRIPGNVTVGAHRMSLGPFNYKSCDDASSPCNFEYRVQLAPAQITGLSATAAETGAEVVIEIANIELDSSEHLSCCGVCAVHGVCLYVCMCSCNACGVFLILVCVQTQ